MENIILFYRRLNMFIKRKMFNLFGLKNRDNYFLDSPISQPRKDVKRLEVYSNHQDITIFHPIYKENITYSFPKRYVYLIENAIIDPYTGMIYDANGKYIAESMSWEVTRLFTEIPRPYNKKTFKKLKGTYLFFPTTPTYYHWLIEDLAPFIYTLKFNVNNIIKGAHEFKPANFFINYFLNKYNVLQYKLPVQVEKLIFVGKTAGLGTPFPPHNVVHPKDIEILKGFFKEKFINNTKNNSQKKKYKIYLSRVKWSRGNENEYLLEKELKKRGFVIFDGTLDLDEQIKLFSKAEVIVGESGAAFSNMIFGENIKVIQFSKNSEYFLFYYNMANICGHKFRFLEVPKEKWSQKDINDIILKIDLLT